MGKPDLNNIELRIGMLRQWINEDRITDPDNLITNEQLHTWLDPGIKDEVDKALDELREQVRQILIDPDRLEFGETKVNLRVGGTVDRIMARFEDSLDNRMKQLRPQPTNTEKPHE